MFDGRVLVLAPERSVMERIPALATRIFPSGRLEQVIPVQLKLGTRIEQKFSAQDLPYEYLRLCKQR